THPLFQQLRPFTHQPLSNPPLQIIIFHILQQHHSHFKFYPSQPQYYPLTQNLPHQIQHFKKYNLTPQHLHQFIQNHSIQTTTKHKLQDIS
ncbi:hypothetical protein, partial [Staphylococcus epidermidis]|uniref:hypothetical protein n=1 Tax=Staphylococcus epidermidis TaxID=1282 RepID=UPI0037D9F7C3